MTALGPVPRRLLRDEAYDALLEAIVAGELPPGQKLHDGELAERLGLSRAPVRQALARLTAERLVVSKPQSYTRVAPVVAQEIRDALAVVQAMHALAVRTAVPRLTGEDLARMRAANAAFVRALDEEDPAAALAADDALHAVPIEVCGNEALAETVRRYTPLLRRLERRRFSSAAARASAARHDALIDACAAGDTGTAVALSGEIWGGLDAEAVAEEEAAAARIHRPSSRTP
ncbi:GntR family transcriptional regulator [Streptomyces noursei]|uniref:GntR family transcriptional regulator n=1 Tax=Streptomyces noursei TaxID=1971 RepID=UPI001677FD6A|nr:GntR family transcriptional regulator [Streptomyces noursei]MCZ1019922.1 GntR family transcriptional regulator [Streptomyces noursei]GGX34379.1 GntR family transcriptional regulator [Streptomyces noursei]